MSKRHSIIRAYLDNIGANYRVNPLMAHEEDAWRAKIRKNVTIETFAQPDGVSFTHAGQTARTTDVAGKRVATAIKNLLQREWSHVHPQQVMLTCAFDNWHGNKRRNSAGVWAAHYDTWRQDKTTGFWHTTAIHWVANTTRGSNRWIECTHLIYTSTTRT